MFRKAVLVLALAGCVPQVSEPLVSGPVPSGPIIEPDMHPLPPKTCGAAELQDLVGQSADRLQVMRFAVPMRVILPGQMVAMDYRPDRLTINVRPDGTIGRVACG